MNWKWNWFTYDWHGFCNHGKRVVSNCFDFFEYRKFSKSYVSMFHFKIEWNIGLIKFRICNSKFLDPQVNWENWNYFRLGSFESDPDFEFFHRNSSFFRFWGSSFLSAFSVFNFSRFCIHFEVSDLTVTVIQIHPIPNFWS